jgi:solute carrier family 25 (adenine nucleotide translocator) protein 4/5/6/31
MNILIKNMSSNFFSDFILGGFAGIIAKTVAAPLERVKLLLQTQDSNQQLKNKKYKGFFDCGKRILLEEGVMAYWRGNSANVVRYFPTSALNFGFKDMFGRRLNQYDPVTQKNEFMKWSIITGGLAGTCTTLFIYPLDLARTRMGVDVGKAGKTQFNGLFHCMQTIFKTNGIRGLYNGLAISIPSIFLYRGLYFGFWDIGKSTIPDYKERSLLLKFLLAQTVTMTSETLSYPTDTIRRRMMMNSGLEKKIYNNTMHCIQSIFQQEGWAAFFKGNLSNMLRGLSSSLVLVLYDEMKKIYISSK